MVKHVTMEMVVDNVGKMDKDDAKCVLKGEASINGSPMKIKMVIACDGRDLFEGMGIDHIDSVIDVVLQDPAQTKLIVEE
ncbi:MAG: hypothetical protein KAJ33_02760 [Thermoplasmata archaeon]|nr:hypothetical protein [Thermoplasmata archaeon]